MPRPEQTDRENDNPLYCKLILTPSLPKIISVFLCYSFNYYYLNLNIPFHYYFDRLSPTLDATVLDIVAAELMEYILVGVSKWVGMATTLRFQGTSCQEPP